MARGPTGASRNPYTPDMGARPPFLAGRDPELEYFEELLDQLTAGGTQKHLVLTGLRGVGKTVLLNEFEFDCESVGWAGEVRELAEESRIAHVVAKAARKALLQLSATRRAGDSVRRALRVLKGFTLTLGDLELQFDVDAMEGIADSGDLADDLRDVFTEIGQAAAAHGSGFALVLDEMQNLSRPDMEALIVGLHRAKQKSLPVALVAAGLPLLPDLTGDAKSYAERGFEFRRIGPLPHDAAVKALEEPAGQQGVAWQGEALDRVVSLTQGYPYFLQEYGREIWRMGLDPVISAEQVAAAEPVVQEYLDENFFRQRVGKLPDAERRYLSAMAELGDGPQETREVAALLGQTQQALSTLRDRLIKASLIYAPRRGCVDFTVPLCGDYVRRHHPLSMSSA
jgi:hypothetical protein